MGTWVPLQVAKDTTPSGTIFKAELLNNEEGAQYKTVRFRKALDEMTLTSPSAHDPFLLVFSGVENSRDLLLYQAEQD